MPLPSAFASAASYWVPRHIVQSAWHEHAPFAAWIIENARPRTLVELGTHNGFSLYAFAEAVRRIGLDTRITAIDSWEGDDQAGLYGQEVLDEVAGIVGADYSDFVELKQAYFSMAAPDIPDGSVDLLHIDGRHGYEDVKEDYETYVGKLSPRGVVLFHDCFEFRPGFGVHRFWDEISTTAPSFRFEHGHGLGVLALGPDAPAPVLEFIAYANEHPDEVREFYHRIGAEIAEAHRVAVETAAARDDARAQLALAREALQTLQGEIDAIHRTTSWRVTAPLRTVRRAFGRG